MDCFVERFGEKVAALEANYNKPLKVELEQIYAKDQEVRQAFDVALKKYGSESKETQQVLQKIIEVDKENQELVAAILAKHGWPGKTMVGPQASNAAFLVVQHSKKEVMEKCLPLLREATAIGEADKSQLALVEDKVRMYNEQPQLYGSQLKVNTVTGKYELYKIEDEANVNKRREEMGLEPLQDYVKRFGIDYQVPQIKTEE
ncbi:hypothetical protein GCM10028895_38650 [Pontibacter rugosus]